MTRTTPDPVFAAAARAELERRVRAGRPTATVSFRATPARRPWVREFAAVAGVLALVGGVAAGVTALHPSAEPGTGPIGGITSGATPEPGQDETATPVVTPTDLPTSAAPTTPPPATSGPTAPPTASTPPVSTAPATPPPATSGTLIGPTGAKQRSAAEIRAWARSIGNGSIWGDQAVLDTSCMAEHGFLFDPIFDHDAGLAAQHAGLTDTQYDAYQVAEYGPENSGAYDWRTAGCHGRSVHLTGQDGAN